VFEGISRLWWLSNFPRQSYWILLTIYTEENKILSLRQRFDIWNESQIDMPRPASGSLLKTKRKDVSNLRCLRQKVSWNNKNPSGAFFSHFYDIKHIRFLSIYLLFCKSDAREIWLTTQNFHNSDLEKCDVGLKMWLMKTKCHKSMRPRR